MQKTVRGDITLTIDGEELTLTPSFKAIASIEAATGKPMGELIGSIASLHVTTVATVLFQAMRANGYTTLSYEKVGDLVADSLSDPEQPLLKAALEFVNGYFGRKQEVAPKKARETGESHWIDGFAAFAFGELHWSPDAFWNATVYDLERALDFIKMKNEASAGEGKAGSPPPLSEDEVLELQRITREMYREEAAQND